MDNAAERRSLPGGGGIVGGRTKVSAAHLQAFLQVLFIGLAQVVCYQPQNQQEAEA